MPLASVAIASPTFTIVKGPVASKMMSSGAIIVGFSKSLGIGMIGNVGDSVIFSDLDSKVESGSSFSSSIIGELFTTGVENF